MRQSRDDDSFDPAPALPLPSGLRLKATEERAGPASVATTGRVRGEQVRELYRTAAVALNAALVGAFMLCGVLFYIGAQTLSTLATWLALVAADFAIRQSLGIAFRKAQPTDADARSWGQRFTVATAVGGLVWGGGAVYLSTPDSTEQLVVMVVISATASGAVPAFGSHLPATFAYILPAMLPFALWSAQRDDPLHQAFAVMCMIFTGAFMFLGWRFNATLLAAQMLRFENLELADSLRRQKEVAEQANVAKSRFLAAASHDLRQPVHALGMFVSALRGRAMDAEAQRLLEHLDGSVEALDTLFVALLDISRLDAGIVQSHLRPFPIGPMLERVCADHAGEALAKGTRVVLHPSSAIVHSDPVLVERIVRNIVANAVRYTARGRVVVGCRRAGARLSLQVWDTGRGIPTAQRERVFEEFFQLENSERDRAKGLGLGLAIVKRLAALLECPLTLDSVAGRGTVLKLSVPLADGRFASVEAPAQVLPALQAAGLILFIDDEATIQEAMRSLLSGWGHEVIVAGSCAQMLERIATTRRRPDLIISDYRLRGDENGIEVIQRLQSEFNDEIPGLLITGDTGPDRLREAGESGFVLLHKPVPRGKLRAAIGNLMGAAAAQA